MQNTHSPSVQYGDERGPVSMAVSLILNDEPLPVELQDALEVRGYTNLEDFKQWVLAVRLAS